VAMGLLDEMTEDVAEVFSQQWSTPDARVGPDPEDLLLSNDARYFKRATVLYADLSGSTKLVDKRAGKSPERSTKRICFVRQNSFGH
jgi:hypothetical protein